MTVIAFNGSARKDGNTAILINHALGELEQEGLTTMKVPGQNMAWLLKKIHA